MGYSKPNPIKQLQSDFQMKDDIQADIAAVDSQGSPLEQSWRTNSKMMRDKRLRERQNEGSTEIDGGNVIGNYARRIRHNLRQANEAKSGTASSGDSGSRDLLDFLKEQKKEKEAADILNTQGLNNYGSKASSAPPPNKKVDEDKEKPKQPDITSEDQGV
tara:strand:+ start:273 stop:752 length:480 start_codon:yes stop_codon:yes gene_type:complete